MTKLMIFNQSSKQCYFFSQQQFPPPFNLIRILFWLDYFFLPGPFMMLIPYYPAK